jgi:hypothetical protein
MSQHAISTTAAIHESQRPALKTRKIDCVLKRLRLTATKIAAQTKKGPSIMTSQTTILFT